MNKYLLEIGTEELPYKFIPDAINQLKQEFIKALDDNKITFFNIKTFATPRRLSLIIEGLPLKQDDVEKILKGPIANIAYDKQGNLTKAALGFANKNGVLPENLYKQDNYLYAKVEQKGKDTKEILKEISPSVILKIKGSHFMRWGDLDIKFQRPIRWIVSLFNNEILPFETADVTASDTSRGHRFSSDNVKITSIDNYENLLYMANVIADAEKRQRLIADSAAQKAEEIGAQVVMDDELLKEVTYLTEWPVPVICGFEEKYLDIPEKVTVTVMATHQRYFPLYKDGKLLNKFITMANYLGNEFNNIQAGNERVVRARLEDAIFFFNEDTQKPFINNVEALKGVTFQKGLGSVYDKTNRIIQLSKNIADSLNIKSDTIERTALLCKADLVTSLVFEFTELQGFIGSDYAALSGEKPEVVKGIKEHYYPLNAESETAESIEGQIVGIADKMDTVTAVFTEGKKISGSQDPLGVRRATLGILKTVILNNLDINIDNLIKQSIELMPVNIEDKDALYNNIKGFFTQRLVIYYNDLYKHDVIDACVSGKNVLADLKDFVVRLNAVSQIINKPDYSKFHEAINRIIRIIKNDTSLNSPDSQLFTNPSEHALWECINTINTDKLNYDELEKELVKSIDKINDFFDNVLVMDENEKIRQNRMSLLNLTKQKFDKIADFSKIVN